jgi:hypothetical protein
MKLIFLSAFITVMHIAAFSQTKGAQIDIHNFTAAQNQYQLDCQVSGMNTSDGQNKFMLCFAKKNGNALQLIPINNQQFLNTGNNKSYPLALQLESSNLNSSLYFILSAGSEDAVRKSLLLVNNELQNINDVLVVLSKSGITPLTYKVYNVNQPDNL